MWSGGEGREVVLCFTDLSKSVSGRQDDDDPGLSDRLAPAEEAPGSMK